MNSSEMQDQRNAALACLILTVCITAAVFFSVFGRKETLAIEGARSAVKAHEALLRECADILQENRRVLASNQAALETIEQVRQP